MHAQDLNLTLEEGACEEEHACRDEARNSEGGANSPNATLMRTQRIGRTKQVGSRVRVPGWLGFGRRAHVCGFLFLFPLKGSEGEVLHSQAHTPVCYKLTAEEG